MLEMGARLIKYGGKVEGACSRFWQARNALMIQEPVML